MIDGLQLVSIDRIKYVETLHCNVSQIINIQLFGLYYIEAVSKVK